MFTKREKIALATLGNALSEMGDNTEQIPVIVANAFAIADEFLRQAKLKPKEGKK